MLVTLSYILGAHNNTKTKKRWSNENYLINPSFIKIFSVDDDLEFFKNTKNKHHQPHIWYVGDLRSENGDYYIFGENRLRKIEDIDIFSILEMLIKYHYMNSYKYDPSARKFFNFCEVVFFNMKSSSPMICSSAEFVSAFKKNVNIL